MAFSASSLIAAGTDTDLDDYTTGTFTPTAGRLLCVGFSKLDLDATAGQTPTISDSAGLLTFGGSNGVGGTAVQPNLIAFFAAVPDPWTGGAISITFTNCAQSVSCDGACWSIIELAGVDIGSDWIGRGVGIVQRANGISALNDNLAATLAAFSGVNNGTLSLIGSYDNASTTAPALTAGTGTIVSGSDIGQAMGGDGVRLAWQWLDSNSTSVTATAAAANDHWRMYAFEVAYADGNPYQRRMVPAVNPSQAVHRASRW